MTQTRRRCRAPRSSRRLPMYMATCSLAPGSVEEEVTGLEVRDRHRGAVGHLGPRVVGEATPARPQAQAVRPEQSNPGRASAAPDVGHADLALGGGHRGAPAPPDEGGGGGTGGRPGGGPGRSDSEIRPVPPPGLRLGCACCRRLGGGTWRAAAAAAAAGRLLLGDQCGDLALHLGRARAAAGPRRWAAGGRLADVGAAAACCPAAGGAPPGPLSWFWAVFEVVDRGVEVALGHARCTPGGDRRSAGCRRRAGLAGGDAPVSM